MITLRYYQENGTASIRAAFARGVRRLCYQCPTGGGKTILFCYIAYHAARKGNVVWIVVHRRELVKQTVAKLREFGAHCGVMAAGWTPNPYAPIQVCLIDSMPSRMKNYPAPQLVIPDETHHLVSEKWLRVMHQITTARFLGVTATPCRLDGKGLGDFYEHLILGPSVRELMDAGALCKAEIFSWPQADIKKVHTVAGDYNRRELAEAVNKPRIIGDAIEHYRELANNTPAIAFCVNLEHAENVAQQFRDAGYNALRVDGKMDQESRDAAIRGLSNGSVQILTSCDLISEGVDIPVVTTALLLRPTKSLSLYLQQVGRVLRPAEGKSHAIILDHSGNILTHDTPWADREWSLDGVKRRPGVTAQAMVTQCSHCYRVYDGRGECPYCGFIPVAQGRSIEQEAGKLVKFNAEAAAAKQEADRKKREVWGASTRQDLERIAQERGYDPRWVARMMDLRRRYGRPVKDATPQEDAAVA